VAERLKALASKASVRETVPWVQIPPSPPVFFFSIDSSFLKRMTQTPHVAIVVPLSVGIVAILCTTLIHALPLTATVNFVRHEKRIGRAGTGLWIDIPIVALTILYALAAHLIEIALWAGLFVALGEFPEFGTAYYHSAVNYTTLGYGDLLLTPSWRLLGPLEAADGMLMFGVSTAMVFAVIQLLLRARFTDLRTEE
jgi:hypothetical protein